MTHRDFVYWLQGFFEITEHNLAPPITPETVTVTPAQAKLIERHLELVFAHDAYLEEQEKKAQPRYPFIEEPTYCSGIESEIKINC